MSDDVLHGPFVTITDFEITAVMTADPQRQRAVHLRLHVLKPDDQERQIELVINERRARAFCTALLAQLSEMS